MSREESSLSNSEELYADESTKDLGKSISYDQQLDQPIYALPEEEILSYIESPQENSKPARRRRNRKKKGPSQKGAAVKVPPLKLVNGNLLVSESSADRMTGTPHSVANDAPTIFIKDEESKAVSKFMYLIENEAQYIQRGDGGDKGVVKEAVEDVEQTLQAKSKLTP